MVSELTRGHLESCPVWKVDDSGDFFLPVFVYDPLPTDGSVLILKARFTPPNGTQLNGTITDPPVPLVVTLDIGDQSVGFNKALPQFAAKELKRLFELLGAEQFPLFPLRYETDFHFPGEPNIAGVFDIDLDEGRS